MKLARHIKFHHSTKDLLQCSYCDYKAKGNQKLHIHVDRIHADQIEEKNYSCENCGKAFIFPETLSNHQKERCKIKIVKPLKNSKLTQG